MSWLKGRIRQPEVTNNGGAANVSLTAATLQGMVVRHGNENPAVHIYWGLQDGGTDPMKWEHNENLGVHGLGRAHHKVEGLEPSTVYYYRVFAANSAGEVWAPTSATFTTRAQPPVPSPQAPEDARLALLQKIRAHFGQGDGGGLDVHIPYSRLDHPDLQLEDWDATARQMAAAERSATVGARVANELFGAALDIKRSQQRAEQAFQREAKQVQRAFRVLGLEPPEIRTEGDLRVAERQLVEAVDPAIAPQREQGTEAVLTIKEAPLPPIDEEEEAAPEEGDREPEEGDRLARAMEEARRRTETGGA